jgi:hypothetical protein
METEVSASPPKKRFFPLSRPLPPPRISSHYTEVKPERTRSVRRLRSTRSSISLIHKAKGEDIEDHHISREEVAPPLPLPPAANLSPYVMDSAFLEQFILSRVPSKRLKVADVPQRSSFRLSQSVWALPVVVEKKVLTEYPNASHGNEVAPRAPLFDLEMFGDKTPANIVEVKAKHQRRRSGSLPAYSSFLFEEYLEADVPTFDGDTAPSASSSATEESLDECPSSDEFYSSNTSPENSPELPQSPECPTDVSSTIARPEIDPDAAWLYEQADRYRVNVSKDTQVKLPTTQSLPHLSEIPLIRSPIVKSKSQPVLSLTPAPTLIPEQPTLSRSSSLRLDSRIYVARVVPYEKARLVSWDDDSSDDDNELCDEDEAGHGGLTPSYHRTTPVLSRRTSIDYFNFPLRTSSASPSSRTRASLAESISTSRNVRPVTPPPTVPADGKATSDRLHKSFSTPERQILPRADALSRRLHGLATPPVTPDRRRPSTSASTSSSASSSKSDAELLVVVPMLEQAVKSFPSSMLQLDSPVHKFIDPAFEDDFEFHLPTFRLIFPQTSDFMRSTIYMHVLALDYLESIPSNVSILDALVDPNVFPCPIYTQPSHHRRMLREGIIPSPERSPRVENLRRKLLDCLRRLLEATSGPAVIKQEELVPKLIGIIKTLKEGIEIPKNVLLNSGLVTLTVGAQT